jgi:hypothetical protein
MPVSEHTGLWLSTSTTQSSAGNALHAAFRHFVVLNTIRDISSSNYGTISMVFFPRLYFGIVYRFVGNTKYRY